MSEEKPKLTKANEVFISEYLKCFNGTEAYCIAYPKSKRESARRSASDLLTNPDIKAEITRRLDEVHMSADEALKLLSDIARGDVGEIIDNFGSVDLLEARSKGKTKLIKKIKQRTITKIGKNKSDPDEEIHETEVELYPADAAIRDVLKIHGKYKDTVQLPNELRIQIVKASDATSNQ